MYLFLIRPGYAKFLYFTLVGLNKTHTMNLRPREGRFPKSISEHKIILQKLNEKDGRIRETIVIMARNRKALLDKDSFLI